MSDKSIWLIICRFAPWEMHGMKYPAFAHQYIIEVSNSVLMEGFYLDEEHDKFNPEYSEELNVKSEFRRMFNKLIGKVFDGEILIVEKKNYCILLEQFQPEAEQVSCEKRKIK